MFRILKFGLLQVSAAYMVATIINAAVPFLMIPILTRFLSRTDYGVIAMFQVMVALLVPIIGLSTHGAVSVKYFKLEKDKFPSFVTACVVIIFSSFFLSFLLIHLFGGVISQWTAIPIYWLWSPCIFVLCQALANLMLSIWQVRVKPVFYGIFLVLSTIANIGLSIWFVVGFGQGWTGRVLGQVCAGVLFGAVSLIIMQKSGLLKCGRLKESIFDAIVFGLPLVPNYVLAAVGVMIGRILVNNLINIEEAGLYSVGYQVASILLVAENAFNLAFIPWLFEKLKRNEYEQKIKIVRFTYVYFAFALIFAFIFGTISPMIFRIFVGAEFFEASRYVIWFAVAFAFNGMHMMIVNYIFFVEKTVVVTLITIPILVLNIFFSYLFIILRGSIGAAQAHALISMISFFCVWSFSCRVYSMPWFSMELFPIQWQKFVSWGAERRNEV